MKKKSTQAQAKASSATCPGTLRAPLSHYASEGMLRHRYSYIRDVLEPAEPGSRVLLEAVAFIVLPDRNRDLTDVVAVLKTALETVVVARDLMTLHGNESVSG